MNHESELAYALNRRWSEEGWNLGGVDWHYDYGIPLRVRARIIDVYVAVVPADIEPTTKTSLVSYIIGLGH